MTTGNLLVVPAKTGDTLYWEGSWRSEGKPVKRRLGLAHLKPRRTPLEAADGESLPSWQRSYLVPKGTAPDGALVPHEAQAQLEALIRQHAIEQNADKSLATFGLLADAWLAERELDVADQVLKATTLRDYRSMLSRSSDAVKPRGKQRRSWLMNEWEQTRLADISLDDIERFEAKLRKAGLSARTRRKYEVMLSMLLDFAVRKHVIERNVLASRGRRKNGHKQVATIDVYSFELVEQIAAAADNDLLGNAIRLAATTGCRMGELLSLRWRDVNWNGRSLHVKTRYTAFDGAQVPKSGKGRTVPLADQAVAALEAIREREEWTQPGDLIIGRKTGNPRKGTRYSWTHLNDSHLRKAYKQARDVVIAGTDHPALRFHDLRHSFGTALAAAGVPITTIQGYMGHSSISTTSIYVHWQPQDDAADKLSAVFSSKADSNGKPSSQRGVVIRLRR